MNLKRTPLYEDHLKCGARMVPFSGWEMPVQYTGIIEEHLYTRTHASLFDICHMGEFVIKGGSAAGDVDRIVTCRIDNLKAGCARYGFILDDNGGVIDDMIIFRKDTDEFMIVVNAGTIEKDREWIKSRLSPDTGFTDISSETAKIDVQGPGSVEVTASFLGDDVKGLKRFNFRDFHRNGVDILVSATGYTGEKGYELFFNADNASVIWDGLSGFDNVKPGGLGARDSLRLEMGYSLYGHEIDEEHTPVEADLMRFVYMDKDFIGRERLAAQIGSAPEYRLAGFICEGRRSAREGFTAKSGGEEIGVVTSGVFSPCLKKGVGLCYIRKDMAVEGTVITLTKGRVEISAEVKMPPFITSHGS